MSGSLFSNYPQRQLFNEQIPKVFSQPSLVNVYIDFISFFLVRVSTAIGLSCVSCDFLVWRLTEILKCGTLFYYDDLR